MFKEEKIKFDDEFFLNVYMWLPSDDKKLLGTVQLAHGMSEHLGRYHQFAKYLADLGFVVLGADHYGHGKTCVDPFLVGVCKKYDFMSAVIKSIKLVRTTYSKYFTGNNILFAHSMGSMALQRYIELYPDDFSKVIISGTDYPTFKYALAKLAAKILMKKKEVNYSKLIHNMGVGAFNKKFKAYHPLYGWLTNDENIIDAYSKDKYCGKVYPVNYYYSLAKMLRLSKNKKERSKINRNLEILIISGLNDPVGSFGKGPMKLCRDYLKLDLFTRLKLYPNARHELLNELEPTKSEVYNEIKQFISN